MGEGGLGRAERERKSSRRKERDDFTERWRFPLEDRAVCRGCVGLWHDDLGQFVKKNHIARDYYTAAVSAAAAAGAGGGHAELVF